MEYLDMSSIYMYIKLNVYDLIIDMFDALF